ncbi:hypothetical protein JCM19992_32920 [Thermostilla marina]
MGARVLEPFVRRGFGDHLFGIVCDVHAGRRYDVHGCLHAVYGGLRARDKLHGISPGYVYSGSAGADRGIPSAVAVVVASFLAIADAGYDLLYAVHQLLRFDEQL